MRYRILEALAIAISLQFLSIKPASALDYYPGDYTCQTTVQSENQDSSGAMSLDRNYGYISYGSGIGTFATSEGQINWSSGVFEGQSSRYEVVEVYGREVKATIEFGESGDPETVYCHGTFYKSQD